MNAALGLRFAMGVPAKGGPGRLQRIFRGETALAAGGSRQLHSPVRSGRGSPRFHNRARSIFRSRCASFFPALNFTPAWAGMGTTVPGCFGLRPIFASRRTTWNTPKLRSSTFPALSERPHDGFKGQVHRGHDLLLAEGNLAVDFEGDFPSGQVGHGGWDDGE